MSWDVRWLRGLLGAVAFTAAVAVALLLIFPAGFPNYDTVYFLAWGTELADGVRPDYGAPLAPTPHPLAMLGAALISPLEGGMTTATMIVAYASLGLLAYFVYRLGSLWFDPWIAAAAALIVLTRAPFLSNGLRAYVDVPYIVLCLAALLIESRRPRAGWPVLGLLAVAGLLRPEAWLFSVVYVTYLLVGVERVEGRWRPRWRPGVTPRGAVAALALALAAPLIWAGFDLLTTSDPLYSFFGTRETVETLERQTGPLDMVLYGPRRLGEVLQWPGMIGAAAGLALGLTRLPRRSARGATATALALAAFALLGSAGLAIIPRYTMLAAALLAIFCALALLGWRLLPQGDPWRGRWRLTAVAVLALFVLWLPNQYELDSRVGADLADQGLVEDDLNELAAAPPAFEPGCGPISVPNHRAVPRLALALGVPPSSILSNEEEHPIAGGYYLAPASEFVIRNFILDPNDPARVVSEVPAGFRLVAANQSWRLYGRCESKGDAVEAVD